MTTLIIGSAILGIIIFVLIFHLKRLRLYKEAAKFHGPAILPIIGNALDFLGSTEEIMKKMTKMNRTYSSPYRIWLGPALVIFISDPEQIKKILSTDKTIEKSDLYRFFRPWVGNGLFSAIAPIWRVHRKLIGPTFNLKILESFVEIFAAQSKIMVELMESKLNGPEFVLNERVSLCTLDIICESAMGVSMRSQTDGNRGFAEATRKQFLIVYNRIFKVWLQPDVIFNLTKLAKEQEECLKTMHGFTNEVIRKKTADLANSNRRKNGIYDKNDTDGPSFKRKAYLDLLMELTHDEMKLSDSELREEVDTMMVAGNDTSSNAICFAMLMIASHPDIQSKIYEELCEIYGNDDINDLSVTSEDLPKMEYMERVIKETLRLFPNGPIISRCITEDVNIGEYTLPKGSTAMVEIFATHRSEKYWTDPLKFDPDRFLPEEISKRHHYSYIPFSAGPRNCIGARFAMMEMKTVLATVLRRYILKKDNILPIPDIELKIDTVLKTVDAIKLRIERRVKLI